MKKIILFIGFAFLSSSCFAEGPLYRQKDRVTQLEFENTYQDLREISSGFIRNSTIAQPTSALNVSSGAFNSQLRASTSTITGDVFFVGRSSVVVGTSGLPGNVFGRIDGTAVPVGVIHQATEAYVTSNLTTAGFTTMTPMTLTPGVWCISITCDSVATAAAIEVQVGWATATNSSTGHQLGKNAMQYPVSAAFDGSSSISQYLLSPTVSTTYFVTGRSFGATITTSCNAVALRQ